MAGGGGGRKAVAALALAWVLLTDPDARARAWLGESVELVSQPATRDLGAWLMDARQIVEEILAHEEGETAERGAVVLGIQRQGPAARAGLEPADAIVELGGERVSVTADLWRILGARQLGARLPVTFVRDGELRTSLLEVAGPPVRSRPPAKRSRRWWEIALADAAVTGR